MVDNKGMKKIMTSTLCLLTLSHAIEIDIPFVTDQVTHNKQDVSNRTLLVKYYMQHANVAKARQYTQEILQIDAKNSFAQGVKKRLDFIASLQDYVGDKSLSVVEGLNKLYQEKDYKGFLSFYEQSLNEKVRLDAKIDLAAAFSYANIGEYEKSKQLLSKHDYGSTAAIRKLKEKIEFHTLKTRLNDPNNPQALDDYVYLLGKKGDENATIKELQKLVQNSPENVRARILLAQKLYWGKDLKGAFHTLYRVRNSSHESQRLYANILYDMKDYTHALYFLPKVAQAEKDEKVRYELLKREAYALVQVGKKEQAELIFKKLSQLNPNDHEVQNYQAAREKNALLSGAVAAHKVKNFTKAVSLYVRYYALTHDPKIAKEIAEIYYFNKKQKRSFSYFKDYLRAYPQDTLIWFHYASALEHEKRYHDSIFAFNQVLKHPRAKEFNLALYHGANALMHTYKDRDWVKARGMLEALVRKLKRYPKASEKSLLKYASDLLKTARGPIRKPTKYKDIILTEGSYKFINPADVFAAEDIRFENHPSTKLLLRKNGLQKTAAWMDMNYVNDADITHHRYRIGVDNIFQTGDFKWAASLGQFSFEGVSSQEGFEGDIEVENDTFSFGVGIQHFDTFDTFVPRVGWKSAAGDHNIFIEANYQNGAFMNYRDCMVKNQLGVYHLGFYDSVLLDDLTNMEVGIDYNHFEDNNDNLYGQFTYPLWHTVGLGVEHSFLFNENIEYNSNVDVCSHPVDFYDATYLKYQPKFEFKNGNIALSVAGGYSFDKKEQLLSYGMSGAYSIENFATLSWNCDRLQSSFTSENMTFCHLNVIQDW